MNIAQAAEIRSLAEELGLTCISAYKMDATKAILAQAEARDGSSTEQQPAQTPTPTGHPTDAQEISAAAVQQAESATQQQLQQQSTAKATARMERKRAAQQLRGVPMLKKPWEEAAGALHAVGVLNTGFDFGS